MSQRPPRSFRQRQADSGSSSDPDSDPGRRPDGGLGGRVSQRALGAPRSRGRVRVWATSRRAGASQSRAASPGVQEAAPDSCSSSPDSSGGSSGSPSAPPHEAGGSNFSRSSSGKGAQDTWPGNLAEPSRARAERRRQRGAQAQEDYLPLSMEPQASTLDLKGSSSSDSEGEPASGGARNCRLRLRGAGQAASNSDGGEEGSSEEEALKVWEAQQMRKVLYHTDPAPVPDLSDIQNRHTLKKTVDWPISFAPVNLEIIKKQLSSRLASLEGVHRSHQMEYEKCLQNVDSAKNAIMALEKAPDPAPTYAFYRGLKAYLAALVDCLSEKIVVIQRLEVAMHSLLQERATSSLQQRQAALQKAAVHFQRLAAGKTDGTPEAGSLADDAGTQKLLEGTASAHRTGRRKARESRGRSLCQEGVSSEVKDREVEDEDEDEDEDEGSDFQERREAILQSCHSVFEDVIEEFSDVQKILLKFQQWREQFPDSYREAYASLCLPKLFGPFIRIQMLDWNPLKLDCISLLRMPWFQSLEGFANIGAAAQKEEDSPDREILPAALDKTVLPHITGFVRFLWDPLSTSQTRSLVQHSREIVDLCAATRGRRGHAAQELMDSVVSRLKKAVEEDVFIPLYPQGVVEDKASPHSRFQEQQFWSAVKLLRNILLWDGLVLEDALRELALDKLLNRYLVVGLSNACPGPGVAEKYRKFSLTLLGAALSDLSVARQVVESLPESWLSGQQAGSPIPQLTSLVHVLVRVAQQLHDSEISSEVGDMVLLLVKMKALTQARAFVERNQLDLLRPCVNAP